MTHLCIDISCWRSFRVLLLVNIDGGLGACYDKCMSQRTKGKARGPSSNTSGKKNAKRSGNPIPETHEIVLLAVLYLGILLIAHYLGVMWAVVAFAAALAVSWRILYRLFKNSLWEQWIKIDKEARDPDGFSGGFDWRPLFVFGLVALVLTANNDFGHRGHFRYFASRVMAEKDDSELLKGADLKNSSSHRGVQQVYRERVVKPLGQWWLMAEFGYWAMWRVFGFLILPVLIILAIPGEKPADYGLGFGRTKDGLKLCGVLFVVMFAAVFMVSFHPSFLYHYPFPWPRSAPPGGVPARFLVVWALMYAAQFVALEFFFRGFMLHGLKKSMGAYSIFAMLVPYVMIHFGKPIPETLGSFAAGMVLGTIALAYRSIWCGVIIHVAVAWSMDILAIFHKDMMPGGW